MNQNYLTVFLTLTSPYLSREWPLRIIQVEICDYCCSPTYSCCLPGISLISRFSHGTQTLYMFFPHFMLRYFAVQPREVFFLPSFDSVVCFLFWTFLQWVPPFLVDGYAIWHGAFLCHCHPHPHSRQQQIYFCFCCECLHWQSHSIHIWSESFLYWSIEYYCSLLSLCLLAYCISLLANMYVSCIFELISPLQCNKHVYRFLSFFYDPPSVKAFLIAISASIHTSLLLFSSCLLSMHIFFPCCAFWSA